MTKIVTVLLDRDGTIIRDKHYLADPAGVELFPGTTVGLRNLTAAGMRLFIVTNQSGIGRGYFSERDYYACHAALENFLRTDGVFFEGSVFCPHAPEMGCDCRKPSVGMWQALVAKYGLDPSCTVMVGDKVEDIAFGKNANVAATVLVLTGKGTDTAKKLKLSLPGPGEAYRAVVAPEVGQLPDAVAHDLSGAANYILDLNGR